MGDLGVVRQRLVRTKLLFNLIHNGELVSTWKPQRRTEHGAVEVYGAARHRLRGKTTRA